ncbi:hypothetical protein GGQ64_002583 [Rhizobium azooxidifex]|uniref:Uncharacterized protein n=1 Tax=Mycoplana azooxidifex TaxID=1636188 RepID=A0A7W6D7B6_9HYPH|nr:hypothetical protein [Mycoplana azooxidifex]
MATEFRKWNPDDPYTNIYMESFGEKGHTVLVVEEPNDIMNMIVVEQRRLAELAQPQ